MLKTHINYEPFPNIHLLLTVFSVFGRLQNKWKKILCHIYSPSLNPSYLSKEVTAFVGSSISQCCELTYMYDSPEILLAFKHI